MALFGMGGSSARQEHRTLGSREAKKGSGVSLWILLLSNLLVFQLTRYHFANDDVIVSLDDTITSARSRAIPTYPLDFPKGSAVALPSIRVTENEDKEVNRRFYGGKGDKKHLGGFTEIDLHGISPAVWKHMVSNFGIKSVLDVGCGRGISTSWFALHGVDTLCVEGSHDAVLNSVLPDPSTQVVEHDFSRGPWWPPHTVDAVWCVEFLEHVGRNFHKNYITAFRKSALIFATHSIWGGWHHVEVHDDVWWITKFEMYGFKYSPELTTLVRNLASEEKDQDIASPTGKPYFAQHIFSNMQVFINPVVAALPEHAHLFAEHGCFEDRKDGKIINRECNNDNETPLPREFYPLPLTDAMDHAWTALIQTNVKPSNEPVE